MKKIALSLLLAMLLTLPCVALPLAGCGEEREEPRLNDFLPEEPRLPEEGDETAPPEGAFEEDAPREVKYLKVLADGLNVRTGAGTEYDALGQAQKGTLLSHAGEEGEWYKTYYRGKSAYVAKKYAEEMTLTSAGGKIEHIVKAGERLLGVPYVYGATRLHDGTGRLLKGFTASAFDCSSLMQYLFYTEGVLLDVTTRTQIKQGKPVPFEEIERGDLLFFTNDSRKNKTGIERVGHVALYLGEGYILHTASDFAKIEPLTAKRESYFVGARRVL